MQKAEEIVIDIFRTASVRIHWAAFINALLCSVVLANIYATRYSYDKELIKSAPIFIMDMEAKITELEKENSGSIKFKKPNGEIALIKPFNEWQDKEKLAKFADYVVRQKRALNAVEHYSLGATQPSEISILPFSTKMSASDLDIFCGILMIVVLIWMFFTSNHIIHMANDARISTIISNYPWLFSNIFITLHTRNFVLKAFLVIFVVFLPAITMLIDLKDNIEVAGRLSQSSYAQIIEPAINRALFIVIIISGLLLVLSCAVLAAWRDMLARFK
jgi:hypothetical protein